MSQALKEIGISPSAKIGSGKIPKLFNGLTDSEIAQRALLLDQFGMVGTSDNPVFLRADFASWLSSPDATRTIEYLVKTDNARQIGKFFKFKSGSMLELELAAAKTPEEVIEIFGRNLANPGRELENQLRLFPTMGIFNIREKGLWVKRSINSHTRAGNYLPTGVKLLFNEPTQFMHQFDKLMSALPVARHAAKAQGRKVAAYDQTFLDDIYQEVAETLHYGSKGDLYNVMIKVEDLMNQMFVGMGYTPKQADSLTRMREEFAELGRYMNADLAKGVGMEISHGPMAINQLLSDGLFIVNPRELERVIRQSSQFREFMRLHTRWGRAS
jgi:hypothetical protein